MTCSTDADRLSSQSSLNSTVLTSFLIRGSPRWIIQLLHQLLAIAPFGQSLRLLASLVRHLCSLKLGLRLHCLGHDYQGGHLGHADDSIHLFLSLKSVRCSLCPSIVWSMTFMAPEQVSRADTKMLPEVSPHLISIHLTLNETLEKPEHPNIETLMHDTNFEFPIIHIQYYQVRDMNTGIRKGKKEANNY